MSEDYQSVYSVDSGSNVKYWQFNNSTLVLKQTFLSNGTVTDMMPQGLFVWNNGQKLFIGGLNQMVKVYSLDSGTDLYITTPIYSPSVSGWIYTIWVNTAGNKMFIATSTGCKKLDWNGASWSLSIPTYFTTAINSSTNYQYVHLLNN